MRNTTGVLATGLIFGLISTGCSAGDELEADVAAGDAADFAAPTGAAVAAVKRRSLGGEEFVFVKHVDAEGNVGAQIFNASGALVDPAALPVSAPRKIGQELQDLLDAAPGGFRADTDTIDVVIALNVAPEESDLEAPEQGGVTIDGDGRVTISLNGIEVSEDEIDEESGIKQRQLDQRLARLATSRREALRSLAEREPALARSPALAQAIDRGDASVTLPMEKRRIEALVRDNDDLIAGIELYHRPTNLLSAAMIDTNVNPWAINYSNRLGASVGIYMSEGGCPNLGHITNYMRLSGLSDSHNMNVSAIVRGVSPCSFVYCRSGYTLPALADLNGYGGNPRIHIETHSWGYTGSDNEGYQIADRDFDDHVYNTAVSVFKSNGNFGFENGFSSSPGKALNVISVGNYDDATDTINNSSSYRNSEIGNEKPELVAPGTGICAGGVCMTGTSQASPHAAAFAADLMGAYSWLQLKPYFMKAFMLAGADKVIAGGADKVGVGGLNFYRAYYDGTNTWWEGSNSSFSTFDASDYMPNNGTIDRQVYISASETNVRIAMSWLNSGSWTYTHRLDSNPIGMDLDMCVYAPNGSLVGCSTSWDNPYELVSFDPTVSGNYRVSINRFANRDVSSKLHLALSINWD